MKSAEQPGTVASGGRSDLSAKLDVRRRARRRSWFRRSALALGVLALLVGVVWLVGFSTVLDTREVVVEGNDLMATSQVIATAQVPLGTPMLRLPTSAIRERLLALPATADVALRRDWPHRLTIQLSERSMVFQRLDAGTYHWVDESGRIFHMVPDRSPGVVAVTGTDEPRMLADVATVVRALPRGVAEITEHLEAPSVDHIVVLLTDGRTIVWGNASQSVEKAALLGTLLGMPGSVYDVSVPSYPAVR